MGPAPAVAATRAAVRRSLDDLAPDGLVLVACSGGADSVALARATAFVAPRQRLRAGAVCVDHGLQAGSAARARTAAQTCVSLGLDPVEVVSVDVPVGRPGAGGPEGAARAARRAALTAAARRHRAAAVLLGHTLDDQAETVLLGLARGSGARSLAGMAAQAGLLRRPLLGLPRALVRQVAAGLPLWEDPHNADPGYARARVRLDALPAVERALGPGVTSALARTAGLLRADADALDGWAAIAAGTCRRDDGSLDVDTLAGLPPAVRHRVLRAAALSAGCPAAGLTAGHVAALDRLVTDWHGQRWVDLPGSLRGRRRGRVVGFERP